MSIKFPISPLQAARIDQQATVYKHGLKGATDPAPEGGGVIIEAATNKTVNGLQVPALTDDQLLAIYNATVAGKAVTITDATGMMHFSGVTADMVSDEVFVSFVYFDVMVLEYGEGDATTFKAIGGKKLYLHDMYEFSFISTVPTPFATGPYSYNVNFSDSRVVTPIFVGFKDGDCPFMGLAKEARGDEEPEGDEEEGYYSSTYNYYEGFFYYPYDHWFDVLGQFNSGSITETITEL